ncbi:hypothetical protein [Methylobacterium sp. J-090]|uniref:hypothetical protein n=1 Tax=Methylobacterium sp. J-090 TaxID=2836666 RepID=UPI001FB942A9|nr:hypothetical protein [Methylobacterium sp. J-090]MCJ2084074.1 hypothetical protein [Methylobacterium sp. J-090]
MDTRLAKDMARAADHARRRASAFPGSVSGDALPWAVVEAFDAEIRGHVERDRRIEEERDRVLIAAVGLAETRPEDGPEALAAARTHLADAIDYLEQAVLRFGIVNRRGAQRGLGESGQHVTAKV